MPPDLAIVAETPRSLNAVCDGNASLRADANNARDLSQVTQVERDRVASTQSQHLSAMEFQTEDGTLLKMNAGQLTGQVNADGTSIELTYAADNKCTHVKDQNGDWSSVDGVHFKNSTGQEKVLSFNQDWSVSFKDAPKPALGSNDSPVQATSTATTPGAADRPVDAKEMELTAIAIRNATGLDNWIDRRADRKAINTLLEDKNEAQRKAIDQIYQLKFGKTLDQEMSAFESGSDLDAFRNILNRKDRDNEGQRAGEIHSALLERSNLIEGHNNSIIEKEIRDTLAISTSSQIERMDRDYRDHYGVSLHDALINDPNLSQATKDSCAILLKGSDARTDSDTAQLVDIALGNKNATMFDEAMRDASPAARQAFLDQGGEQRIRDRLSGVFSEGVDARHAIDYARYGKLDATTQIADNTGVVGLTTNRNGIELALNRMTDQERQEYMNGKQLAEGKPVNDLSGQEQTAALEYYNKLHGALVNAGNETEQIRWEDMIAKNGGSFVSTLAPHRGTIYNDSVSAMQNDIANMSEADWQDCKRNPQRREELQHMLKSLDKSPADVDKLMSIFDAKMDPNVQTYEQARRIGVQSLTEKLAGNSHWYGSDEQGILTSIQQMSADDQRRYRADAQFRTDVNKTVDGTLAGPSLDAAHQMLDQVTHGQAPVMDVVSKLKMNAVFNTDGTPIAGEGDAPPVMANPNQAELVRDLQDAFKNDPSLHEKLAHPATEDDRKFAESFQQAARAALGPECDDYIKPLLESGHIPVEKMVALDNGMFSNDVKQAAQDLINATPEEKKRLETDSAFREQVLGFMNDNQQKIVIAAMQQGELKPEDQIRAAIIGWSGTDDIVSTLKSVKPDQVEALKSAYAAKYGSDLDGDLLRKLGGQDRVDAERVLTSDLSLSEQQTLARQEAYDGRNGLGSQFVADYVYNSATGRQADDALEQMIKSYADYEKAAGNLTPEQRTALESRVKQMQNDFRTAIDNHRDTKATAANYVADAAIGAATIGSVVVTGGADVPLIVGMAVAGATIKVGSKALLMGNDYDMSSTQLASDIASGAVSGAGGVLGPGEVAAVFKVGESAAKQAVSSTMAELSNEGAATILKDGGQELLDSSMTRMMRETLTSGAPGIKPEEIRSVAEMAVSPELTGEAREQAISKLTSELEKNLNKEFQKETQSWLTNIAREQGFDALTGTISGGAGGVVDGLFKGETPDRLAADALMQSLSGAAGALLMGYSLEGLGRTVHVAANHFRSSEAPSIPHGDPLVAAPHTVSPHTDVQEPRVMVTDTPRVVDAPSLPKDTVPPSDATPDTVPRRENVDVDGRPSDRHFRQSIQEKYKQLTVEEKAISLEKVKAELQDVRAIGPDGKPTSAYDSLMSDPVLSAQQKAEIIDNLSEVREHLASVRLGDRMHPDPEVNWIHTQGELAKVLQVGRANKLSADELEDSLLASMYSDSVKFAWPPPEGETANFFTHHLDGALAASEVLTRKGFPEERVDRIVQAVLDHQIAPPEFMGELYYSKIAGTLDSLAKLGNPTPEKYAEMKKVLADMTVEGADGKLRIAAIANVKDAPKIQDANGNWEVNFTPEQRELMNLSGTDRWSVPVDPTLDPSFSKLPPEVQQARVSQYKISQNLIDGDAVDNYSTLGGASKFVTIRGPETKFADPTVWASVDSIDASFNDAYKVLSPEAQKIADQTLNDRNAKLFDEQSGIKGVMDAWLKSKGMDPSTHEIPFYNHPLKYPEELSKTETDTLQALQKKLTHVSEEEEAAATRSQIDALKYKGLTEEEIKQFQFAKEIRSHMADELRQQHRTQADLPGKFESARDLAKLATKGDAHEVTEIPEAVGEVIELGGGVIVQEWQHGLIVHKSGTDELVVTDERNNTSRIFRSNRMIADTTKFEPTSDKPAA